MTLVQVRGKVVGADNVPAVGQVVFRLSEELLDSAHHTVFSRNRLPVKLDAAGQFSVSLAPNDDPTLQPANTYYSVELVVQGAATKIWTVQVPLSAASLGVDIADLAPTTTTLDPVYSFAYTTTVIALTERVALLEIITGGDSSGFVLDSQIPSTVARVTQVYSIVSSAINDLTNGAPSLLDTLGELAAALLSLTDRVAALEQGADPYPGETTYPSSVLYPIGA